MKRVMKRRFVPLSYERDLMNRLQTLRQGKRSVEEYFKEMELLLVWTGTRESMESKMARFLGGLNEEIAGFVEMFPYHTLQDLVDQAMRTERKIQQESHGRSHGRHSIAAPWRKQQFITSFGGGRSQGSTPKSFPSNSASKMAGSSASSPANQQRPAASSAAPSVASGAASSTRSREIVCHKCHGRGHIAAQCPRRRTMLLNEKGEWESESDPEDEGPRFDEEPEEEEENEIQPDEGDQNCFISLRVLSVTAEKEENGQ
jgi:hypothetical protein